MELEGVYKTVDQETMYSERRLNTDKEDMCANEDRGPSQTEARAQHQGGLRCFVVSTACFGLVCLFLVASIIVLHMKLTAERETHTTQMFQSSVNDQIEKEELQSNFTSVSQKKLELETRVNDLRAEKRQLEGNFSSLSQKKLELETRFNDLNAEKSKLQRSFDSSSQKNTELETRIKDLTADKTQLQSNFSSLNQKKLELETRINDLSLEKTQLQSNFSSLNQKKLELETRVNDLSAEKTQLQSNFSSVSQKKLELETRINDLNAEKNQIQRSFDSLSQKKLELEAELQKSQQERCILFMSNESKSWSESRQFCRDRGADLVMIKTEEKQKFISSFVKEMVWIGLSDIEQEGNMTWVDNSTLSRGFWSGNEPSNSGGKEDCVELIPHYTVLKNWNDLPCSNKLKGICEIQGFT